MCYIPRIRSVARLFLVFAALTLVATSLAQTQQQATYLPAVFGVSTNQAALTTLDTGDNGFVSVAIQPGTGRRFLGRIDRDNKNVLVIEEDIGTALVDVPLPSGISEQLNFTPWIPSNSPSFLFPGPKQGVAALAIDPRQPDKLIIYATTRDVGDDTGVFKLKRLIMEIPTQ